MYWLTTDPALASFGGVLIIIIIIFFIIIFLALVNY